MYPYTRKKVNWKKVKAAGVDFVIIRLGYRGYDEDGDLALDSKFKRSSQRSKEAGLDVGVYFFSQAKTTDEGSEKRDLWSDISGGKGITYPVVFDMEPIDGADRITDLNAEEKTQIADAFCQVIDRNGYTPMIYGNPQWLKSM